MKYIVGYLLVGAVALVITTGNNGLIAHLITGTNTASFLTKAGWPLGIALAIIVGIIFKVIGGRGKKQPQ